MTPIPSNISAMQGMLMATTMSQLCKVSFTENSLPVATDDYIEINEDNVSITFNVITHTDPNGADHDIEGEVVATAQDSISLQGALFTLTPDGTLTYNRNDAYQTLPAGSEAEDQIEYEITDNDGEVDSAPVTISITGINDQPILSQAIDD